MWHAEGLKKTGIDEDGNLQWPLPFDDMEKGIMEPYERALQYKGENVVQVGPPLLVFEARLFSMSCFPGAVQ